MLLLTSTISNTAHHLLINPLIVLLSGNTYTHKHTHTEIWWELKQPGLHNSIFINIFIFIIFIITFSFARLNVDSSIHLLLLLLLLLIGLIFIRIFGS